MPTEINIIHFIAKKDVPIHRTVTYGRIIATIRPTKAETHPVRLTVGGDRIDYYPIFFFPLLLMGLCSARFERVCTISSKVEKAHMITSNIT